MSIPKYDEIMIPALKLLSENKSLTRKQLELPLAKYFNLSDDEITLEHESGGGKIFFGRISWALSYMNMAGLTQRPKRGVYQISETGKAQLNRPKKIHDFIAEQLEKREPVTTTTKKENQQQGLHERLSPQEELYESFAKIKTAVCEDIIDIILSKSPQAFERLVVSLLQSMGYGDEIKSSAEVTKYSNDKGIDGIIKEDVLGLGKIHIQAKRYNKKNVVSREEIQKFVGALAGARSDKGVFITTSYYSKGAIEYAENLSGATLVLIDGKKLSGFIYEYGLGMQVEQTIKIKKLDGDFWDSMEDVNILPL